MALYKNYYHLFPLYHFSRHPTHIPRVLRFKPPLSSRSKHLTVQRPWPHHQSYDLDNKTAKWPRHPKSCDQDTVLISRMSTILAYVGFRVFARQFLLFVRLLFLLGKGYISEEYHLFLRGGKGTLTFIVLHFLSAWSIQFGRQLHIAVCFGNCHLFVRFGNYFTPNILDTLIPSCQRWCASFRSLRINLQRTER